MDSIFFVCLDQLSLTWYGLHLKPALHGRHTIWETAFLLELFLLLCAIPLRVYRNRQFPRKWQHLLGKWCLRCLTSQRFLSRCVRLPRPMLCQQGSRLRLPGFNHISRSWSPPRTPSLLRTRFLSRPFYYNNHFTIDTLILYSFLI